MTTLGKVLLFLNVAAAAAVAYFATDNWSKRQSLNASGLKYALLTDGFPTEPAASNPAALDSAPGEDDAVAIRLPTGTGRYTTDVPFKLLKAHFTGAEGRAAFGSQVPPLSVKGEVERVNKAVNDYVSRTLTTDDQKLAWLCGGLNPGGDFRPGLLAQLADTYGQRQVIKQLLTIRGVNPQGPAAEKAENVKLALAMLKKRFDAVLAAPNPKIADADAQLLAAAQKRVTDAGTAVTGANQAEQLARDAVKAAPEDAAAIARLKTAELEANAARDRLTAEFTALETAMADSGLAASRDDADRRQRALALMAHLDPTDAALQKRMMLLFGQPEYLRMQTDRLDKLRPYPALIDEARVSADAAFYSEYERLKQAARDRDRFLDRQKELLAEVNTQVADAQNLLKERKTYRDERTAVSDGLRTDVEALAASQEAVETELFNIQLKVGKLLRDNFDLEDKLVQAEKAATPSGGR